MSHATVTWHTGDALTVMRTLPAASVDLVLSSPPFLGLRSYLPPDDPDKALEMGSEATPGAFIDALLDIVEESRRVLAPHGSLCLELGDTYAGSGGAGGDYGTKQPGIKPLRDGQPKFGGSALSARRTRNANRQSGQSVGWPLAKSLCMIPELLRVAMVYGFNPLTGRETPRWRARNVVRWVRPNPPVGELGDKFRPGTSEMLVACVSSKRFFDLDAVRAPAQVQMGRAVDGNNTIAQRIDSHPAGAPPLDWWSIPTAPYKGSHYAAWPPDLLVRPVKAMCPERVCSVCGVPSERITAKTASYAAVGRSWADNADGRTKAAGRERNGHSAQPPGAHIQSAEYVTTGYTDCSHNDWRPGAVLDMFAGSGTTGVVAHGHGRSAVLIDLDARNLHLARERIGFWLAEADEVPPVVTVPPGTAL